jgi:hypothetical protein
MTTSIIRHVQARINDSVLERVSRLYSASLEDILNELLQNARRANATSIDLTVSEVGKQNYLTIADDGDGVATPDLLLSLGESQWQKDTVQGEDPAGMGFFSLALRPTEVHSGAWKMQLEPAHFSGEATAPVFQAEPVQGTRITFPISGEEVRFLETLDRCGKLRYFPLPLRLQGREIQRQDFLKDALMVREWNGLRIGVVRQYSRCNGFSRRTVNINFHGITISHELPYIEMPPMSDAERGLGRILGIWIDVVSCSGLKLVLPARKEVVQDDFWRQVMHICRETLFQYVAQQPHHRLAYRDYREASTRFGMTLKPAVAVLEAFHPEPLDSIRRMDVDCCSLEVVRDNALLVDMEAAPVAFLYMLERAINGATADDDYQLLISDQRYEGYPWYDALPRISGLSVVIQEGDSETVVDDPGLSTISDGVVDALFLEVRITHSDTEKLPVRLPLDIAIIDEGYGCLSDTGILFPKATDSDVGDLVTWMIDPCFQASDEGDSWERQQDEFVQEATVRITKLLHGSDEATRQLIRDTLCQELLWQLPRDKMYRITITGHKVSVDIAELREETSA